MNNTAVEVPECKMDKGFRWTHVSSIDEIRDYYNSKLYAAREVASFHGYALCIHGSEMRDFDIVAVPWVEGSRSKEDLAVSLHHVFSGGCCNNKDSYHWEIKPNGRVATSFPVLWLDYKGSFADSEFREGSGIVDLSVMPIYQNDP